MRPVYLALIYTFLLSTNRVYIIELEHTKKRNYWRGRRPGGKYTHDDSINHLRESTRPNHMRAVLQRSTLFYIILCLTTIRNILFPNCFKLQAARPRRAHVIIEEGVHPTNILLRGVHGPLEHHVKLVNSLCK